MRDSATLEKGGNISFLDTEPRIPAMEMAEKKPYLYCPNSCQENCSTVSRKMENDFEPIFKLASVFGLSFYSSEDKGNINSWRLRKFYDVAINILAVIALVTTISFSHNFALSNAMMITYAIKATGALLIRLNLLTKCRTIPILFETLSQLYTDVSSTVYKSLRVYIYMQCMGMIVLNSMLFILAHFNLFYETRIQDVSQVNFLGRNITNNGTFNVVNFIFVSYSFNFAISIFSVSICLLICINVHIILRRVIKSFEKTLTVNLQNLCQREELTKDFVKFRRIVNGINQADDVLSFCTFFAYVTCISCFFYSISSFMTAQNIDKRIFFATEQLSVFIFSNFIFLTITCSASKVSTAVDSLKNRVNCMSEIAMKKNLPCDCLLNFMILIDNIKSTNVGMTGWEMFTITRGFVLTTIGVMITYGMILFQFG